jgi:hypothetical protein
LLDFKFISDDFMQHPLHAGAARSRIVIELQVLNVHVVVLGLFVTLFDIALYALAGTVRTQR